MAKPARSGLGRQGSGAGNRKLRHVDLALHLKICGSFLLSLTALHFFFPARFDWKRDLAQLSLLNRQIFHVHNFFVCVILVMMGVISVFGTNDLLQPSPLGPWVAAGMMAFWQLRLLVQFFVYDRKLWQGKLFETSVHVFFTCCWSYLSLVYGCLLWHQLHP